MKGLSRWQRSKRNCSIYGMPYGSSQLLSYWEQGLKKLLPAPCQSKIRISSSARLRIRTCSEYESTAPDSEQSAAFSPQDSSLNPCLDQVMYSVEHVNTSRIR